MPESSDLSPLGQAALRFAADGYAVFPCDHRLDIPGEKRSKRPLTMRGLKDASRDPIVITTWWTANPDAMIGIPTGKINGIDVIDPDVDVEKGIDGLADLAELEKRLGKLPTTVEVETPRGGHHLWFRHRDGITNSQGSLPDSVNMRGEGGYVIAPPSMREDGKAYKWCNPLSFFEPSILPDPWFNIITVKPKPAKEPPPVLNGVTYSIKTGDSANRWANTALQLECEAVASQSEPGRNTRLNQAAFSLGQIVGFGLLNEGVVEGSLYAAASYCGLLKDDGETSVRATIASGLKAGKIEPRGPPEKARPFGLNGNGSSPFPGETTKPVTPLVTPLNPLILTARQFVAGFTPPEYLIDGVIQRGYLYSLTARTSHGKTTVSMYLAQAIALGRQFHGRKVLQGSVLFLAGENPDDIRARYLVLADKHGFDADKAPIHFIAGVVNLNDAMPRIYDEAENIKNLHCVIVDTAAAYYLGDDGNSNAQQSAYARLLRQLTFLPGLPATIVNTHPTKNAQKDNLLPVGGGAFVNEVDGNLTLWSDADKQTEFHWQGKFRGPEFEPLMFKMETVTCDKVKDAEGRLMPSVVAMPMGELELNLSAAEAESSDNQVLLCISQNPKFTVVQIAKRVGWVLSDGKPAKSKVQRTIMRLRDDKLIKKAPRGRAEITDLGRKELGIDMKGE